MPENRLRKKLTFNSGEINWWQHNFDASFFLVRIMTKMTLADDGRSSPTSTTTTATTPTTITTMFSGFVQIEEWDSDANADIVKINGNESWYASYCCRLSSLRLVPATTAAVAATAIWHCCGYKETYLCVCVCKKWSCELKLRCNECSHKRVVVDAAATARYRTPQAIKLRARVF